MNQSDTLNKANGNLFKRFGKRHKHLITLDDIERVYGRNLFSIEADAKTTKGSSNGYLTGILYLAPSNISGINTCPAASKGCAEACLFEAGRGVMYPVFRARVIKTLAFYLDPERFEAALNESIRQLKVKAKNKDMIPIVRLNGTSDILWDKRTKVIQNHPDIQFYDYTKLSARFKGDLPPNYDLTFSLHETNHHLALRVLRSGGRVAVVFRDDLPETYWGFTVIDGDKTDLRFLDPHGVIVGLKAKGPAKSDKSGFVQDIESQFEKVA
jgi:hypothetical protein